MLPRFTEMENFMRKWEAVQPQNKLLQRLMTLLKVTVWFPI